MSDKKDVDNIAELVEVEGLTIHLCDMASRIAAGYVARAGELGDLDHTNESAIQDAFHIYNGVQHELAIALANNSPHELTCAFRRDKKVECDCVYYFDQQADK